MARRAGGERRGTAGLVRLQVRETGSVLQVGSEDLRRLVQNDAELSELFMRAFDSESKKRSETPGNQIFEPGVSIV